MGREQAHEQDSASECNSRAESLFKVLSALSLIASPLFNG